METYAIEMKNIYKGFSGVPVLEDVDFQLKEGEIHALLGENGAGKSTLIKILSGAHEKDSGKVYVHGKEVEIHNPQDSHALGIQCIYQELSLVPHLSVANNIFLGREYGRDVWMDQTRMEKEAREMMTSLNLSIDVKKPVSELGIGEQFFTEICRCMVGNAKIVIMDEPTSAMTPVEYENFLKTIKLLRNKNISVIYISHRLDEIKEICDRVTILRDGKNILTKNVEDITIPEIIKQMVGKDASGYLQRQKSQDLSGAGTVLKLENVTTKKVKNVSIELKKGEILGVTGLLGAGKTELGNVIFGVDKKLGGKIYLDGKEVDFKSPKDAMNAGIGLVSEDRKKFGLFLEFPIKENIAIINLEKMEKFKYFVSRPTETKLANECVKELNVKCNSVNQLIKYLSGGNQQKAILSKWIKRTPEILIMDEPTRGIDVGSKEEIYSLIRELAKSGISIIILSSEMPEVVALSDRIVVMHDGSVKGEMDGDTSSQEKILLMITGDEKDGN